MATDGKMSALTPKQEKFAQCVAEGMSQADAYRSSYNCKPTTKSTHEATGKTFSEVSNG